MALVHVLALVLVFTYGSGWDSACEILYQEKMGIGDPVATRESDRRLYVDPGFTCEYLIDGEWQAIRKGMTGERNLVLGITAVAGIALGAGIALFHERRPT